ncbi:hypothetical protein BaRGS_00033133 [Batillaria attramentaria]|uniref:Uncharacterized protein n=1 Tax=Batillaria attramentaria TaxID=370345 RepID=A0ABD0JKZ7_9CAEN
MISMHVEATVAILYVAGPARDDPDCPRVSALPVQAMASHPERDPLALVQSEQVTWSTLAAVAQGALARDAAEPT